MRAEVATAPFPHFVADAALSDAELSGIIACWPDRSCFAPEAPGNFVAPFRHPVAVTLAREIVPGFSGWVFRRYGEALKSVSVICSLMESEPGYQGIRTHSHYYHSPNWIATGLLYVGPDGGGESGTTLNRLAAPAGRDQLDFDVEMAALALGWHPRPERQDVVTVDYRPNRLLAFLDGPLSYHSVRPAAPNATGRRRVLRIHVAAPWEHCARFYGVSEAEYRGHRPVGVAPLDSARVIEWARRDILEAREPPAQERGRAWAAGLDYNFHH